MRQAGQVDKQQRTAALTSLLPSSLPPSHQITECAGPAACSYEGRMDALIDYQAAMIEDPSAYNFTIYNALMCAEGYTGPRCGSCSQGYGSAGAGECR